MKALANLVIGLAFIFITICLYIFVFPETLTFDTKLGKAYNTMAFLSTLFSAIAILIAAFAFRKTTARPKLQLEIYSMRAMEEGPILSVGPDKMVGNYVPLTSWSIILQNKGEISAKNPIVKIRFKNAYFGSDDFPGWKAVEHEHALGWFGFQWTPKNEESQVVHVNFDYELPSMYFSGYYINDGTSIEILIAADEVETIAQKRPIIINP